MYVAIAEGEIVYRRMWARWWSVRLKGSRLVRARFSPYHTGRVIADRGDRVLVKRFGRRPFGSGDDIHEWHKQDLRVAPTGKGPQHGHGLEVEPTKEEERTDEPEAIRTS